MSFFSVRGFDVLPIRVVTSVVYSWVVVGLDGSPSAFSYGVDDILFVESSSSIPTTI